MGIDTTGRFLLAGLGWVVAAAVSCQPFSLLPQPDLFPEPATPVPPGLILCDPGVAEGLRPPRHVLALSSGGLYGAYTSGFLAGWTRTGTRPEFDCVTGVSVGALIAPFAFLGPEFDGVASGISTQVRAKDLFRIRSWASIPFRDSIVSPTPLRELIGSQIRPELLARVAAEHAKGRRLYVATTNLETRRLVVWDLGAVAQLPPTQAAVLIREILLASCSVPAMLPPVRFAVTGPDGRTQIELHVDGGAASPVFVPPAVFRAAAAQSPDRPVVPGANGNVYAIVAGKLYDDPEMVRPRILSVLGAATESILYAHCRAELGNIYGRASQAGMRFHLAAIRQDAPLTSESSLGAPPEEVNRLFREGEQDGSSGPRWMYEPPELCAPPSWVRTRSKRWWHH